MSNKKSSNDFFRLTNKPNRRDIHFSNTSDKVTQQNLTVERPESVGHVLLKKLIKKFNNLSELLGINFLVNQLFINWLIGSDF